MIENKILLNEYLFTNLCKSGFYNSFANQERVEIHFTKSDIKKLANGEIIEKNSGTYKFSLQNFGFELTKEIIKRSPLYSDLYYEF